ncbi:unnamed protein product [Musa banksii]
MAEASELLQKLSLDSPPKTHDAVEATAPLPAQQGSSNRESSNMETPSNRSPTPLVSEFADPNMFYVASGYAIPSLLSYWSMIVGYDGSVNEWDLYQGYAYTPYGTYPFNGSSIPAMAHDESTTPRFFEKFAVFNDCFPLITDVRAPRISWGFGGSKDFPDDYADAKLFVIKSYSEDDIHKSIKYNVWASTGYGNNKLDAGYQEAQGKAGGCPVLLFLSVNTSGQFVGVAEMDVPNSILKHITLENNDNKPVTNSRDAQEVMLEQGLRMLKILKEHMNNMCVLDDFDFYEKRQNLMQEETRTKQQLLRKQASLLFLKRFDTQPTRQAYMSELLRWAR